MNNNITMDLFLKEDGWTKRFVASEPRLSEAIAAYQEAGFEIRLEPLPKQTQGENYDGDSGSDECRLCYFGHEDEYRIIYTRPKKEIESTI